MITLNDIFSQVFPWLEGISVDLGTVLIAVLFLSFLVLGFNFIQEMMHSSDNSSLDNNSVFQNTLDTYELDHDQDDLSYRPRFRRKLRDRFKLDKLNY